MSKKGAIISIILIIITVSIGGGCITNGIPIDEDAQLSPFYPAPITVEIKGNGILIEWPGTGDDTIQYYQVYRKTTDDKDWNPIIRVETEGENKDTYSFLDLNIDVGVTYIYGVSAINGYGEESAISESMLITKP